MKLQSFGHLMRRTDSMEETLMLGKLEGIGSVGLLILELYNLLKQPSTPTIAQWLSGFLMILLNISENQMVFRAGLVDGDHVTLEHHSYFFGFYYYFSQKNSNHLTCPISSSHVNALIQDLLFPRIILKSQNY